MSDSPNDLLPISVPATVAVCPICGAGIVITEIQDWIEDGERFLIDPDHTSVSIDCETAPDIDDDGFNDFMAEHWSMPYVDWFPLQPKVAKWLARNDARFGEA